MLMLFAVGSAQAEYTAGTPLSLAGGETGGASSIAINQTGTGGVEAGTVYVAEWGTPILGKKGKLYRFSPTGTNLGCTLTPEVPSPGTVAVNHENGNLYVANIPNTAPNSRLRTFPAACGAEIGTEFQVEASQERPIPQPATDASGNLYWPNPLGTTTAGKVEKITPTGTKTVLVEGLNRPTSTALDSAGNLFVTTGVTTSGNCSGGKLVKFDLSGTLPKTLAEGTTFLEGSVSTVAIDKSTNSIFVGRGCGATFHVEKYNAAGTKLDDFGTGMFTNTGSTSVFQQIAVNENDGRVYVGNPGSNKRVDIFIPVPAEEFELTVTKSGTGTGTVTSAPLGINCGGDCDEEYNEGTLVTLSQSASPGSEFVEWTGACTGSGTCEVTMSAAKSVDAKFDLTPTPKFKLTVTKSGTGTGTVTSSPPGINCGADCDEEYNEGTLVTLSQSASPGSEFVEWTGACTGSGTCEVTMSAAKSVDAKFDLIPPSSYLLTVTKSGSGTGTVTSSPPGINCGGDCSESYLENTVVTLSQGASPGSEFVEWSGACTGSGTCEVTMSAAKSVDAKFALEVTPEFTLTVTPAAFGNVRSEPVGAINCGTGLKCSHVYKEGDKVELIASQPAGTAFASWTGCDEPEGRVCRMTMSSNKTVEAHYTTTHLLTVKKTGTGGNVYSEPSGINCGTGKACSSYFAVGSLITLTATQPAGSTFEGWTGACISNPTPRKCVVEMNVDKTIEAKYK
jgi:hypothetical protein